MVTIQFTKFANLGCNGDYDRISYGYRIYNEERNEYNNSFESLEELNSCISKNQIIAFLQEYHPSFYELIIIEGELELNGDIIIV